MILTFFVFSLFLLFCWRKKKPINGRKVWMIVSALCIAMSVLISIFSVWSVHKPYATNYTVKWGESEGAFPESKLSYPLYITVYHGNRSYDGYRISGRVLFKIFLMGIEIGEISGTFTYASVLGETPLHYSLNFFSLLLFLFTLFNLVGAFLGTVLAYKIKKHRTTFSRT